MTLPLDQSCSNRINLESLWFINFYLNRHGFITSCSQQLPPHSTTGSGNTSLALQHATSLSLAIPQALEPLPPRRNSIQHLLVVRRPVVAELAIQPLLGRVRIALGVDEARVVVWAQEEDGRVARAVRPAAEPKAGHDVVQRRA